MCDSTLSCYNNGIETEDTLPNTHLEHLEHLVFTGRKELWNAVWECVHKTNMSVKWDGAPAIVLGPKPRNGKFFVGENRYSRKLGH